MELLSGQGGSRLEWHEIPHVVRCGIEAAVGSTVVSDRSQPGGFSPGLASRLVLADDRRVFAKAVGLHRNPTTPSMLRIEAEVLKALPDTVPAPEILATYDDGDWVALVLTDVDGAPPRIPWHEPEFDRVLDALTVVAEKFDAPCGLPRLANPRKDKFDNWGLLAADPKTAAGLDAATRSDIDRFAAREADWRAAAAGDALLHGDLRADNILLTQDEVVLVDWPSAAAGPAWADLLFMLPSVAMQHGPQPDEVWQRFRPARSADPDAVNALLAAVAGFFMRNSLLPPPPNLPRVRAFQRAQGIEACAWLRRRLA